MKIEEIARLAKIQGLENINIEQLQQEILMGGKFVQFPYCISIIVLTYRNSSDIYFLKAGESPYSKGMHYFLLSLALGWWGIPFGPIFTIQSIYSFLRGGKDVTEETMAHLLNPPSPFYDYCPGCSFFAYSKAYCTKHVMAVAAYPERFNQFCNGNDFVRIPILLPKMQCYVCNAVLVLDDSERKSFVFTCPECKHVYNLNAVVPPNQPLKLAE